ncbi:MAG TPA: ATP-dependent protease ATPase subunit HslU [Pseudomonadota bacterium]|nr:ATP-dependent protease ATPase subunit HslU [Pseudomonadota bacterium]
MTDRRDAKELTPRAIVEELDRYIVGQKDAKRAVAIALRNRWRRQQVVGPLRDEITPKNIILIGPTGVGKTEIARRLARLVGAPFVKVEASKFTEVGYVGRDVDSMVRDLVEVSIKLVKDEARAAVQARAKEAAEERLLDLLLPPPARGTGRTGNPQLDSGGEDKDAPQAATREKLRELLRQGKLDSREVELEIGEPGGGMELFAAGNAEPMAFDLSQLQNLFGSGRKKKRKVKIPEARELLTNEESQKLIDMDNVRREAVQRAEQSGIIFIDEIDKIAGRERAAGPDVSREGVQRDLLPIVEGSTVTTKHGPVKTDHVLFIAAGAFHVSKPSDLIPELQGRFPIRVELQPLCEADLIRILSEPENSLCRQYQALLLTEGVKLNWHDTAIAEVARIAAAANRMLEDIGARRLQTLLERLLDELSFEAPEVGRAGEWAVDITAEYVSQRVGNILSDKDLSKYIL